MSETVLNGIRAYYEESGKGESICLLHGFSASSYTWRKVVPILSENFHVYALDLKGFGKSDKPDDSDYSIWTFVDWVKEFFEKFGIVHTNLVGHSLGGRIGLLMAASCPEKIKNLILINPAAYRVKKQPFFIKFSRNQFISKFVMRGMFARYYVKKALKKAYFDHSLITEEVVDNYLEPLRSPAGRRGITSVARAIYNENTDNTILLYKEVICPVLLIWGENDEIFSIGILNKLKNEIRNIEVNIIPECGHVPQEEKPKIVCELITKYIWSELPA
ncbi:MAG: alpha/beta fold hydrolase [Candidatus Scalinduaceae bacterium]